VLDGKLYYQDQLSNVSVLNAKTGQLLWSKPYNTPGGAPNGIAVGYGKVSGYRRAQRRWWAKLEEADGAASARFWQHVAADDRGTRLADSDRPEVSLQVSGRANAARRTTWLG